MSSEDLELSQWLNAVKSFGATTCMSTEWVSNVLETVSASIIRNWYGNCDCVCGIKWDESMSDSTQVFPSWSALKYGPDWESYINYV